MYTNNSGLTTTKDGRTGPSEFAVDMSKLRSGIGSGTVSHDGIIGTDVEDAVSRYRAAHGDVGLQSFMQGLGEKYGVRL